MENLHEEIADIENKLDNLIECFKILEKRFSNLQEILRELRIIPYPSTSSDINPLYFIGVSEILDKMIFRIEDLESKMSYLLEVEFWTHSENTRNLIKMSLENQKLKKWVKEKRKVFINRARCINCKTIIESKYSQDWKACACYENKEDTKGIFIDGGLGDSRRVGGCLENFEDLSVYEEEGKENT